MKLKKEQEEKRVFCINCKNLILRENQVYREQCLAIKITKETNYVTGEVETNNLYSSCHFINFNGKCKLYQGKDEIKNKK